ncbi:endonuclease/exonuclease/phosphatase family protein [Roseovarius aquimarinus]|uniref:Endonuclease/exonuclease/phosphatase family protein n=1 Tax=Roseovarius aquimarinus TaxID=1229156 RepID=A0ABW7I8H6_9RHOB
MIGTAPAWGATMRFATFNADLARDGPGLLLRDILRGDDQVEAAARVIAQTRADVILLQNVDFDLDLLALDALRGRIAAAGLVYPHIFARAPNSGRQSGRDLDRDGRLGEPEDALGHGAFLGQGGMALLSRWPIDSDGARDMSDLLWRDLPGALLPELEGAPYFDAETLALLPLADVGQWAVPVLHPEGAVTVLAFHASPPVFDGPEDRNGRRNHDQLRFWSHFLDRRFGAAPERRFVLMGHANQDPNRSEGIKDGIRALLADPRLRDVRPLRPSGLPREATVHWPNVEPPKMRVSYVLPSRDWRVTGSGVVWPEEGELAALVAAASRHRIVWVDLVMP